MKKTEPLFKREAMRLGRRLLRTGLTAPSFILFSLRELGQLFIDGLPDSDSRFWLFKTIFGESEKKREFRKKTILESLRRLREQGLIQKVPEKEIYFLTEKGKKLTTYIYDRYAVLKKPWDGKLRIVIFDIPEKKRQWREWLRLELSSFEFKQLQKSVYIGKYPLAESFYQEIIDAGIEKYIFIFTASDINRERIARIFKRK